MVAKAIVINPASITQTFWSMISSMYAIPPNQFGGPKTTFPPLGPLMYASQLKKDTRYKVSFWDRNVDKRPPYENPDFMEADQVHINIWSANEEDARHIIDLTKKANKILVAGGRSMRNPRILAELPIDCGVVGDVELVFDQLVDDLFRGTYKKVYSGSPAPPDKFLLPDYSFINIKDYVGMSAQYSRGCPFNCEFCNETEDDGKEFRYAPDEYVKANLEAILATGFRGTIFFVDDNWIGNPKEAIRMMKAMHEVEKELGIYLPKMTQMSLNISDRTPLMEKARHWLRETRFVKAFYGIETDNESALRAAGKHQNLKGTESLAQKIRFVSKKTGMVGMAGGVYGFDQDSAETMESYIESFNSLAIPTEMIGLLSAPPRTRLQRRLLAEGRLMEESSYNNSDGKPNFVPMLMSAKEEGEIYIKILEALYDSRAFFKRVNMELEILNPKKLSSIRSIEESTYSVKKILFEGENKELYRRHMLTGLGAIAKNMLMHGPQNFAFLLGELLTNCAQYTHFKNQVEFLKTEQQNRTYEPWQTIRWNDYSAWKEFLASKTEGNGKSA